MIDKFHLRSDEAFLYVNFVGEEYRVNRLDGRIERFGERLPASFKVSFNEAMTIYDVLGCSRENCHLSGNFITISGLKFNAAFGSADAFFRGFANYFDHKLPALEAACRKLGGQKERVGDTAWRLPMFDFLPVVLQFWESDEEFPASMKLLWDENILDYMHFETTFYAANHLLGRIRAMMEEDYDSGNRGTQIPQ